MGFGASGNNISIASATDVALSNPLNNQGLVYDSTLMKWKNATISAGSVTAANITDATAMGRSLLTTADSTAAKTTLGLNNVDNTSDANKPISTTTQVALDGKLPATAAGRFVGWGTTLPTGIPQDGDFFLVVDA